MNWDVWVLSRTNRGPKFVVARDNDKHICCNSCAIFDEKERPENEKKENEEEEHNENRETEI